MGPNPTPSATALVAVADERQKQHLLERSIKAARSWEQFVRGLADHELVGLTAQCERELNRRGLDAK